MVTPAVIYRTVVQDVSHGDPEPLATFYDDGSELVYVDGDSEQAQSWEDAISEAEGESPQARVGSMVGAAAYLAIGPTERVPLMRLAKFNPYHDRMGRFSSGGGGLAGALESKTKSSMKEGAVYELGYRPIVGGKVQTVNASYEGIIDVGKGPQAHFIVQDGNQNWTSAKHLYLNAPQLHTLKELESKSLGSGEHFPAGEPNVEGQAKIAAAMKAAPPRAQSEAAIRKVIAPGANVNLKGCADVVAHEAAETITQWAHRYPDQAKSVHEVTMDYHMAKGTIASASPTQHGGATVHLNGHTWSKPQDLYTSAERDYQLGYHPYADPKGTLLHELGHVMDFYKYEQAHGPIKNQTDFRMMLKHDSHFAPADVSASRQLMSHPMTGGMSKNWGYAAEVRNKRQGTAEAMAEAFVVKERGGTLPPELDKLVSGLGTPKTKQRVTEGLRAHDFMPTTDSTFMKALMRRPKPRYPLLPDMCTCPGEWHAPGDEGTPEIDTSVLR